MIPTTVTGILLLLVLLLPGFLFVTFREQHRPTRRLSTFRETSVVLAATTVSYAVPVALVVVAAIAVPTVRDELARALTAPAEYQRVHPFRSVAAGGGLVLAGSLVASILGSARATILTGTRGGSAWWEVFEPGSKLAKGDATTQVTATLDDGSEITGVLHSWNRDGEDGPDRDFVLVAPLWIQAADRTEVLAVDAESLVVSARHVKYLSARYFSLESDTGAASVTSRSSVQRPRRSRVVGAVLAAAGLLRRAGRSRGRGGDRH